MKILDAQVYSQRDPIWAGKHYGLPRASVSSTIGAYGCGITSIAQKLTLLGFSTTPVQVQEALAARGGFRPYGSFNFIDWSQVPEIYPQLTYNGRRDFMPKAPAALAVMQMIVDRLQHNDPAIVYVDAERYKDGLQQHFVLAISQAQSGSILIANPWSGTVQDLRPYADTDRMAIRGVIFLDQNFDPAKADG